MEWYEIVIDSSMALGALATVGTLIATIIQNSKQNRRIASLEERQIDFRFRPDLLVRSFTEHASGQKEETLVIENEGEDVQIVEIDCPNFDQQTIVLPEILKKGGERTFFLKFDEKPFPNNFEMKIKVRDKLGRLYSVPIRMRKTGPFVDAIGIEELKKK